MLNAAKSECSSVESLADFWRSPCILPAAEKTRSTPADDAGAAKYCLTILASAGHFASRARHHLRMSSSQFGTSVSSRYWYSSSRTTTTTAGAASSFFTRAPSRLLRKTLRCFVGAGAAAGAAGTWAAVVAVGKALAAGEAAGIGSALPPGAPPSTGLGRGFHTVDHSVRSSRSAHALSLWSMRSKPSIKS